MSEIKRKPGRPPGSKNSRSGALRHCLRTGQTPVQFLTKIYQDKKNELSVRIHAAISVAPYVHARLANIQVDVETKVEITHIERSIVHVNHTDSERIPTLM